MYINKNINLLYKYVQNMKKKLRIRLSVFDLISNIWRNSGMYGWQSVLNRKKGYLNFHFINSKLIASNTHYYILQILQILLLFFFFVIHNIDLFIVLKMFKGRRFIFSGDIFPKFDNLFRKCSIFFSGYALIQWVTIKIILHYN